MLRNKKMKLVLLICMVVLVTNAVFAANDFPNKPITVVVPFAPGGGTDMILRPIMAFAQQYLGQPLVAEYKPGAGGVTALAEFAKAKPDGYTLIMMSTQSLLVNPHVQKLPYDFDDFQAIAQMAEDDYYLAVNSNSPWTTADDFINDARRASKSIKGGHAGVFSPQHLVLELLQQKYQANITPIPFQGGSGSLAATLGGHTDVVVDYQNLFTPHVEAGNLRILASTGEERSVVTPDIPTFAEQGYDISFGSWKGFHAPKGISAERVSFLEEGFRKVFEDKAYQTMVKQLNGSPKFRTAEEFQSYLEKSNEVYFEVLKGSGYVK